MTVGGVDVTAYIDSETLDVQSNLAIMLDTCDIVISIPSQAIYRPQAGDEVIVTSLLGREFGGIAVNIQESQNGVPSVLDYKVTTRDYSFLLDRHCAFKEYPADTWTYDGIVTDMVQTYGADDGFTTNNVQSSFEAEYTRFDYQPVAQSINMLAQQIAFGFYVDYERDVHFFDRESFVSPLTGNTLNADTDTTSPDPFGVYGDLGIVGDLQITEDITQLRNRIFMRGHKVTANYFYTQTFTGDGSTTTFGLAYEPSHTLVSNVALTVNGVVWLTAADLTDGTPEQTVQDDVGYINFESQILRFNVAPPDGASIVIAYKPMLPLVVMVESPADQRIMASRIGDDGVFEYAISDPTLSADDIGPSQARGNEQISKYGLPYITGQFTSFLHGWKAGQSFVLNSTNRFDGELDGETFYVTKVVKKIVSHPQTKQPLFQSTVSFASNVFVF